jgi:hypothetical protein
MRFLFHVLFIDAEGCVERVRLRHRICDNEQSLHRTHIAVNGYIKANGANKLTVLYSLGTSIFLSLDIGEIRE